MPTLVINMNSSHLHTDHIPYTAAIEGLPAQFAENVLDLEGYLDFQCDIDSINRLIELYTRAIEYYGAKQDNKYLHYKSRLQNLMARDEVLFLLEYPEVGCIERGADFELLSEEARRDRLSGGLQRDELVHKEIEDALSAHYLESTQGSKEAVDNLKRQGTVLENRLRKRKDGADVSNDGELLQTKLENVMDWFLEEREAARKKLEEEYQGKEAAGGPSMNVDGVWKKMQFKMKQEFLRLEEEKRKMIFELKKSFGGNA